jgi:hypothetical protein
MGCIALSRFGGGGLIFRLLTGLGLKDLERKRFERGMQELLSPPARPQRNSSWQSEALPAAGPAMGEAGSERHRPKSHRPPPAPPRPPPANTEQMRAPNKAPLRAAARGKPAEI